MFDIDQLLDFALEHFRKLMFPEEWIELDLSLSKSELFALLILDRHKEIMMSQIAEHVHVPMSTATGIVNRLVKHGFIQRGNSESDRRIVVIRLSEQGQLFVEQFKSRLADYLRIVDQALTAEEKGHLIAIATKILNQISTLSTSTKDLADQEQSRIKKIQIE